jgi:shikimate dehydrogenase
VPELSKLSGLSGRTSVVGVIGSPISHSLSPALHNAAFAALGIDWCCVAFEVADGDAARALGGMASLGIRGLSVTMPHKTAVAALVDDCTPVALALGAVNCVILRPDGQLLGHNTDGAGFLDSLRDDAGIDPHGMQVVVVGAGGAARAVVHALGTAGAASVVVINRDGERAARAAALADGCGRVGTLGDVEAAGLIVNATPVGMGADATDLPLPAEVLHAGHVVVDLVYHPAETNLLKAAAAAGAITLGGLGMLVHQAGHAFAHWTGLDAPVEAMRAAARAQLGDTGT